MAVSQNEFTFPSSDGKTDVFVRVWQNDGQRPRFALQIAHGMVEYVDRYADFASFICQNGGIVYGNDHLGHGHTGENAELHGFFAEKDGDKCIVEDMHQLTELIHQNHPGLPVVLLGHSMGSFLSRIYATKYSDSICAAIFMGTSGTNPFVGVLRFLARTGIAFGRGKKPAKLITAVAFGSYNAKYKDVTSANDWLTRDKQVVAAYDADPWCTYKFTHSAFLDLSRILDEMSGPAWAAKLDKDLPCLLNSGDMDPVGGYGEGVKEVFGHMKNAGVKDLELKLYPDARHEILNEINKQEVYEDILQWIGDKVE